MAQRLFLASVLLILAGFQAVGRGVGPYIPYHGVAWLNAQPSNLAPYTFVTETAGRVNLTWLGEGDLEAGLLQRLVSQGVWIVLTIQPSPAEMPSVLNSSATLTTRLNAAKQTLTSLGAIGNVVAISISEELYGCLNPTPGPDGVLDTADDPCRVAGLDYRQLLAIQPWHR